MKPEEVDAALLAVSKLFFTGAGAQQLLEKAQNYLGNPILIYTPNLDVLASSKTGDIQDETWHRIVNEGPEKYQLYKEMVDRGISHKLTKSLKPGLVDDSSLEHRWIIGQLRSANSFVGGVNVLEYRREFEAGDFLFIQGLCEIFSYYVVNSSGLMAFEHPSSEFLLAGLFRGKDFNPMVVSETLSYLDWTLNLVHQVLVARSDSQFKLTNPYPIKNLLEQVDPGIKGIVFDDCIALLISLADDKFSYSNRLVLQRIQTILEEHYFSAGVSRTFSDIGEVHQQYLQAVAALELSIRSEASGCLHHYNNFSFDDALDTLSKERNLSCFYDDGLVRILAYDQDYQTNYLRDVYAVVTTGGNIRQATDLLCIHRNTLNYRVEKISQVFEIDLFDPETSFALNLSLRILKFVEGTHFYKKYQIPH